jgi:ketosteroid isomerase-like protein
MPVRAIRPAAVSAVLAILQGMAAAAAPNPAPVPQPSIQLPAELARVLTDYEAAWRARDTAALARLFAEDGFVMSNNQPPVRGRAAIEQRYTGSGGPLFLRAFAYATDGRTGYVLGGFTNRQGGADLGKYTLTLSKGADGRWLIFSDMDNGNRP